VRTTGKFAILALLALGLFVLPGGGAALNIALTTLTIAFFVAIALLGYRLYREHRFELESLGAPERLVLFASVGVAFLTFTATNRLFDEGGVGVLAWLALLGLCSYGVFWVWTRYRTYG
jgi:hypothetical protein